MRQEKNTKLAEILNFESCKYYLKEEKLVDADGNAVHMRRQSSDVMAYLARNVGEIVSRQTLLDAIWPDTVTTDDSLVQCIADIRRVIGRDAVQTFPKKGYQLNPNNIQTPNGTSLWSANSIIAGGALATLLIAVLITKYQNDDTALNSISISNAKPITLSLLSHNKSLAVLPFVNLGGGAELQYFSDGFSADLTTDLSKIPGLTVISYASSFEFPDAESNFKQIAKDLGVRYLVRGTVRQYEDQFRINVSVIDPVDGANLWAERYDKPQSNPFGIQENIIGKIIESLSLGDELDSVITQRTEPDAYYMLLKGLEHLRNRTANGNIEARKYFQQALALQPQYARAHASLALTYGREQTHLYEDKRSAESTQLGLESAVTAIQLDSKIPHAYQALGLLNLSIEEFDNALAAARHAIKLDQNYADGYALLAEIALFGGDLNEGLAAIRRAKLLHPRHPAAYHWVEGQILYLMKEYGSAQALLEEAISLESEFVHGFISLAATYAQQGKLPEAAVILAKAQSINQDVDPIILIEQASYRDHERRNSVLEGLGKVPR